MLAANLSVVRVGKAQSPRQGMKQFYFGRDSKPKKKSLKSLWDFDKISSSRQRRGREVRWQLGQGGSPHEGEDPHET